MPRERTGRPLPQPKVNRGVDTIQTEITMQDCRALPTNWFEAEQLKPEQRVSRGHEILLLLGVSQMTGGWRNRNQSQSAREREDLNRQRKDRDPDRDSQQQERPAWARKDQSRCTGNNTYHRRGLLEVNLR
jgi:hypothetical protein